MLKIRIGVDMTHIPYKGSAPSMTALASGEVDFSFNNIPSAQPMLTPGRIRALGNSCEGVESKAGIAVASKKEVQRER